MSTNDITYLPGHFSTTEYSLLQHPTIIRTFLTRRWSVVIFVETAVDESHRIHGHLYRLLVCVHRPLMGVHSWYDSPWASHSYLGGDPIDGGDLIYGGDPPTLQKGIVDTLVRYYGRATVGGAIKKARKLMALSVKKRLRGEL